jgi:hypothetical protein
MTEGSTYIPRLQTPRLPPSMVAPTTVQGTIMQRQRSRFLHSATALVVLPWIPGKSVWVVNNKDNNCSSNPASQCTVGKARPSPGALRQGHQWPHTSARMRSPATGHESEAHAADVSGGGGGALQQPPG